MLIKDPYLQSNQKGTENISNISNQPLASSQHFQKAQSPQRHRAFSYGNVNQLQARVRSYQNELKSMQQAYSRQGDAARKLLGFNQVNHEYHEAMKMRNFQLNTKLNDAVNEMQLNNNRYLADQHRSNHEKDQLLRKYEEQTDQLLRLRANCNTLMEQKARMEEEVSHLSFIIEKEAHQHELQIKEQLLRTESMERTYRDLIAAKDQQIGQLASKLRLYQDQNRKLNDINKTLQLTKDKYDRIDNLSQIHHPESNIKMQPYDRSELKEQKTINDELRKQIDMLKTELKNIHFHESQCKPPQNKQEREGDLLEKSKWQGLITSVASLRQGIAKEVFELFVKSVGEGEKKKTNSLVIFIQNWKCLDMERLEPYLKSYFEARNSLKTIASGSQAKMSSHFPRMREVLPLQVGGQTNRNNLNQWILSTIQFTKNQRERGKPSLNNWLLFLFRLLTIQYRVRYPMQGKSYQLDGDVVNELQHELMKGVEGVLTYQ